MSTSAVSPAPTGPAPTAVVRKDGKPLNQYGSWGTSLVLHGLILVGLALLRFTIQSDVDLTIDTVFEEEASTEEFEREIEADNTVADSLTVLGGSGVSTSIGGTGAVGAVSGEKLDSAESLKVPTAPIRITSIGVPGTSSLTDDLGAGGSLGQIKGDTGRVVDGYGAALGQISQELVRLMREQRIMAVWLFDESESMRDDQKEIRDKFDKIYLELGLAQRDDSKLKASEEPILTSIMSFGQGIVEHTPKPTSSLDDIRAAIEKIGIDESGKENTCAAVMQAIRKYQTLCLRQKRRLVTIIVSDESGDDGDLVEEAIQTAKRGNSPIYVMGRYSVFGYPYARMRWTDPKYGLEHWLVINRGPETPFPELLQFDGLHERWDYDSSGFGPYEQVRMAKETGGIFFLLPGTEDNITGVNSETERKFEQLNMKEYLPDLSARVDYARQRDLSKFRSTQFLVIAALNPHKDADLQMREIWYSPQPAQFAKEGAEQFQKALKAMQRLNEATRLLDTIAPLRSKEPSQRWRANYDLIHAQCLAYRVRLFQFLLALDQHQKQNPQFQNPINNSWNIGRVAEMLPPDEQQAKITKVDLTELQRQLDVARKEFEKVVADHPGTPWARRAQFELNQGFGMKFYEIYRNPNYDNLTDIKFPTP